MTEFCVCAKEDGHFFEICLLTPMGKLIVMLLDRKNFLDLREKVNACHAEMLAGEVPECVRKAFGEEP